MLEKVEIFVNSQKIKGTIFYPKILQDKNPAVIFFTGMTSNENNYIERAKELVKKGIIVFTLSYRGHGESEGDFNLFTINDLVKDGFAAYNFIASKNIVDKEHIGICGVSVGATIAVLTANKFPISSLVLRAPAVYSDETMKTTLSQLMTKEKRLFNSMENIEETATIQSIKKFTGDLLVVVSENDQIIPISIPQSIYNNAIKVKSRKIKIILEATHNLSEEKWKKQFISILTTQFSNHL